MHTAAWFACHAVVSSTLTVLNKQVAETIDFPWVVVLLQCSGSAIIAMLMDIPIRSVKPIQKEHLPASVLISFLFTMCLVTSISGLHLVHVPMAVVGRNLTPFVTALLELAVLQAPLTRKTLVALAIGLIGGVVYLIGDSNANFEGFFYVLLNAGCVAVTTITEKRVSMKKTQSPLGNCLLRNALAVPFVALILLTDLDRSYRTFLVVLQAGPMFWLRMAVTSCFGAITGVCLFELQSRVTATTVQVAALCYKLISTLLSLVIFPKSLNDIGWVALVGYTVSTLSISIYTFSFKPGECLKRLRMIAGPA